jgi:hypothetical protein
MVGFGPRLERDINPSSASTDNFLKRAKLIAVVLGVFIPTDGKEIGTGYFSPRIVAASREHEGRWATL